MSNHDSPEHHEHLIGRLCTKLAGRESSRQAIIVDVMEGNFVLIDGQVKRRRCNLAHLELFPQQLKISPGASSSEISQLLEKEGISVKQPKEPKEKSPGPKPTRKRSQQPQQPEQSASQEEQQPQAKKSQKSPLQKTSKSQKSSSQSSQKTSK